MKIIVKADCEGGNTNWTVGVGENELVLGACGAVGGEMRLLNDIRSAAGEKWAKWVSGSDYPTPAGCFGPSGELKGEGFEVDDETACAWLRRYGNVLVKRLIKHQLDDGKWRGDGDYSLIHAGVYGDER